MRLKFSLWSRRLSTRLLLAYLGAWFMTAALVAVSVSVVLELFGEQLIQHSVIEVARDLRASLKFDDLGRPTPIAPPPGTAWVASTLPRDMAYRVYDDHGEVSLWSSPEAQRVWSAASLKAEPAESARRLLIDGLEMEVRVVPIAGPHGRLWLQLMTSDRLIHLLHANNSRRLGTIALNTALISILLLGAVLFYALRRLLAPIHKISREAHAIELERLDRRLDPTGIPSEVLPLVDSFNHALGRLELEYANQRRFLADTAHELKTPLALLRGQIELNGTGDTAQLLRDIDHITRHVQQLLVLAEVSEKRNYVLEPVKPEQVVAEVLDYLAPLAGRRDVTLKAWDNGGSPDLRCDRSALFVLLKNLVENAIAFAPPLSVVSVTVDRNSLSVRDQGPGVPPQHLPHLFERFWRAPERQDDGAGLGLSICLAAAHTHGWRLEVRNRSPGAEFVVSFR